MTGQKRHRNAALPVYEFDTRESAEMVRTLLGTLAYDGHYFFANFGGTLDDLYALRRKIDVLNYTLQHE